MVRKEAGVEIGPETPPDLLLVVSEKHLVSVMEIQKPFELQVVELLVLVGTLVGSEMGVEV